jgi:hypothetical protein
VRLRRARADDTATLLARAEQFVADGHARKAIDELTAANRRQTDAAIERALVRIRLAAWSELDRTPPPAPGTAVPDLFEGTTGIPEVSARDLDATKIRSAINHHGGLVVRGLLSAEWCARLRDGIDRSWEAFDRFRSTKAIDPAWFDPADTDAYGLTVPGRAYVMNGGTAYVPDSPRLLFDLLDAFEAAGVKRVVTDYFNEPPALSLLKLAQRRLAPEASGGWHQDAAVYGPIAQTLNFWVPVSRCGDVAPGLEMFPRALDYLVGTYGTEGVDEYRARVEEVGVLTAETPAARPVFEAGDAAVFDQFLLHQTAASPDFREQRYGFESWFFAPSTYPDPNRWIPLVY